VRSLMKNGDDLGARKVILPRPRRYRSLIGKVMNKYRGEVIPEDDQQEFFDAILRGYPAERVILTNENALSMPQKILDYGSLYGKAGFRSTWVRYLFPENPCEFFLAIRNPATLIPAVLREARMPSYEEFMHGADPRALRWEPMVEALKENNPGCPITIWCNEDTPLIWPELLREISDIDHGLEFAGEFDVLSAIMHADGFERMQSYMASHPPANAIQRRRVIAAFVDKYGLDDVMEEEVDLPGWTPEFVDELTELYEDEVYRIERMSGVNVIST